MESLSLRIGAYLAAQLGLDEERQAVLSFGALALLQNGSSAALTLILATAGGVLPHTLAAIAVTGLLRHNSGGVHLGTPLRCALLTAALFTGSGFLGASLYAWLSVAGDPVGLAFPALLLLLGSWPYAAYAPVAAANRPLGPERKARLRKGTLLSLLLVICVLIAGLAAGYPWAAGGLFGFLLQALTLTPVGYRIAAALDSTLDRTFGR